MADKQALRATLEALKELKAEYYINSKNAFYYLKTMRWYEALRDSAQATGRGELIRKQLSVKQVSLIVETFSSWIHCMLNLLAAKTSTLETWSCESTHTVSLPVDFDSRSFPGAEEFEYEWSFDCAWMLGEFIAYLEKTGTTFSEEGIRSVRFFLVSLMARDAPILIFSATGERISFKQFVEESRFRQASSEGWEGSVLYYRENPHELEGKDLPLLEQASVDDQAAAHTLLQSVAITTRENLLRYSMKELQRSWNIGCVDAESYLYDPNLWERASYEYTLGHTEIERRIALNVIHMHQFNPQESSPGDFIDELIAQYQQRFQENCAHLKDYRVWGAPDFFIKQEEDLSRQHHYIMLALRQNRKWLCTFLSR